MIARKIPSSSLGLIACLTILLGARESFGQQSLQIRVPGPAAELRFQGVADTSNRIQWVTDISLSNWVTLTNIVLTSNRLVTVIHPGAQTAPKRFYRLVTTGPPTNPHPEELVWIPPGVFMLGSPSNEFERYSREGPQTQVTLTRGFWMGMNEVTQSEYYGVMNAAPSHFTGFNRPVETVSWHDATNYCGTRTALERSNGTLPAGYAYRLPTEAEWEYAARAGSTTRFSYGDDPTYAQLGDYAWFGGTFGQPTQNVQTKLPNAWGLYDMYGNVYEWCWDRYFSSYPGGSLTDPKGPATGAERVLRGGSNESYGRDVRSAYRDRYSPEIAFANAGFRVVLAPVTP